MDIYSFDKVSVIADRRPVTGFFEGSAVKIEYNEDSIMPKVGLDGTVSYAGNANRSAKVTFSLSQDSASLPLLRKLARDRKAFPLVVRDATEGSGFLLQSEDCAVLKVPGLERGKETTGGEIAIFVPRADI